MLIVRLTVVGLSLLLGGAAQAPKEQRFVVLPSSSVPIIQARVIGDVDSYGSWEPTTADIDGLETGLTHISELKITGWRSNIHIEHPERYFRQYIGVSHQKQRRIYINAFCVDPPPSDWRNHLYVVIDGRRAIGKPYTIPSPRAFQT